MTHWLALQGTIMAEAVQYHINQFVLINSHVSLVVRYIYLCCTLAKELNLKPC